MALRDAGLPIWRVAQGLNLYPAEIYEMLYGLFPKPALAPSPRIAPSQQGMYVPSPEHLAGPNPLDTTGMDNVTDFQSKAKGL